MKFDGNLIERVRRRMGKITVKICGLKTEKDVKLCMKLGVDVLGFVTEYPISVPWNLNYAETKKLISLTPLPFQTCLVTGGTPQKVIELAKSLHPSMVQLHFKETLDDIREIARILKPLGINTTKTIPFAEDERTNQFGTTNIEHIVKLLCETDIYGILVDSRTPSNATEKGAKLDPLFYAQIKLLSSKPVILAGGITPNNVKEIIKQTEAKFIDVMTGVEESPGVKDEKMLTDMLSRLSLI